jgi:hypothetical protein
MDEAIQLVKEKQAVTTIGNAYKYKIQTDACGIKNGNFETTQKII